MSNWGQSKNSPPLSPIQLQACTTAVPGPIRAGVARPWGGSCSAPLATDGWSHPNAEARHPARPDTPVRCRTAAASAPVASTARRTPVAQTTPGQPRRPAPPGGHPGVPGTAHRTIGVCPLLSPRRIPQYGF